ncbi:hypothetical protein AB4Z48_18420 [Cupriavidus sp. 2TAF22]|uniref:hypothetical protein n=1 Tax=unclassified Cupriavidus TaxID=2640874 RepID=UPI003F90E809
MKRNIRCGARLCALAAACLFAVAMPAAGGVIAMSPDEVATRTAIGAQGRGGVAEAVLELIDGIGQVPLAGPALVSLIAGVADVIGWMGEASEDRPLFHDSLTLPQTQASRA